MKALSILKSLFKLPYLLVLIAMASIETYKKMKLDPEFDNKMFMVNYQECLIKKFDLYEQHSIPFSLLCWVLIWVLIF